MVGLFVSQGNISIRVVVGIACRYFADFNFAI